MSGGSNPNPIGLLTPRERDVLDLLREGLTNAQIAQRLGLGQDTVKQHVSRVLAKLGVRDRYEAAYWPERPPWWSFAPLAGVLRGAASAPGALGRAAAVVLVAAVLGGVGLLVALLLRDGGDAAPVAGAWTAEAPAPVLLDEPVRLTGGGWTLEVRAANLGELELVALADEQPAAVTLIDVRSGETVATGSFGSNLDVLLQSDPPRLIVIDRYAPEDRILLFDLSAGTPSVAEAPLPARPGCKGNVCLFSGLSRDGRELLVPLRSWLDTPECQGGGDGKRCTAWRIGVVDLATRVVTTVPIPAQCYGAYLHDFGLERPAVACDEVWFTFDGPSTLARRDWPAYAPYVDGGRVVREDGYVTDEHGEPRGGPLLPPDEPDVGLTHGWPLDGARALLGANVPPPNNPLYTDLLVADLSRVEIEASLAVPDGTSGIVVLDPARAVVLVRGDAGYELRLLDLNTLRWSNTVPLDPAIEGPVFIAR